MARSARSIIQATGYFLQRGERDQCRPAFLFGAHYRECKDQMTDERSQIFMFLLKQAVGLLLIGLATSVPTRTDNLPLPSTTILVHTWHFTSSNKSASNHIYVFHSIIQHNPMWLFSSHDLLHLSGPSLRRNQISLDVSLVSLLLYSTNQNMVCIDPRSCGGLDSNPFMRKQYTLVKTQLSAGLLDIVSDHHNRPHRPTSPRPYQSHPSI